MASCDGCIHEKLCVIKAFPEAFENTKWEKKPCDHYVPASNVAEVVRCKDCKHAYINSFSAQSGVALCKFWTDRAEGVLAILQKDDFCSYGKLTYKRFIAELGNTGNVSNDDLHAMYEAYLDDRATE